MPTGTAGSIAGALQGSLDSGPVAAPNLQQLFTTIDNAGQYQQQIINSLPAEIQQQYAAYKSSNAQTGQQLQQSVAQTGQNLLTQTAANYGPNNQTVQAGEAAALTAANANVPAQQNAIRQALAATGGFGRGNAATALAAPVVQAGQQYNQSVANLTTSQLQQQQQAQQQAINTLNSMNDQTAQQLFGMNVQQALQVVNGTNSSLSNQLTQLINQSNTQTQQTLATQGANIQNQYNANVAQNAFNNNQTNGWINAGTNVGSSIAGALS
jgi:hypothetical protein